jgi:hypothetical protein
VESELVSDIRLMTGTMWHRYIEDLLKANGVRVETEISVEPGLPEGWSGTADWLFWHPGYEAWALGDLKTTKGEGIRWIKRDGAKLEHLWQLSAYFWALVEMGFPMVRGFAVLYLPMNDTPDKADVIEPTLEECEPLPREAVWGQMKARWQMTQEYLAELPESPADFGIEYAPYEGWLNDKLAPEQDRVQTLHKNKQRGSFEVKLVPHWSAQYCPFPDDLCACNEQGTTKIGEWVPDINAEGWAEYTPRKGYEDIEPLVRPELTAINRLLSDIEKETDDGERHAVDRGS